MFKKLFLQATDPLIIFAIIGFVIVGADWFLPQPTEMKPPIVITQNIADAIIENRAAIMGRTPTTTEKKKLIQTYLEEEILVREAVTRGLHLADGQMRKTLRDKMEFLLAEELPEPSEEELAKLRIADPEHYMAPRSISFEHIFFNDKGSQRAEAAFDKHGRLDNISADVGDKFWLGRQMDRYYTAQLLTLLGHDFVQSIWNVMPGAWHPPIQSARGWHIVRVNAIHDPKPLDPETVNARLLDNWRRGKRAEMRSYWIEKFADNYDIVLPARTVSAKQKAVELQRFTKGGNL